MTNDLFSDEGDLDSFLSNAEEEPAQPLDGDGELTVTMLTVADLRAEKATLEARLKVVNDEISKRQERILVTFDARSITKMTVAGAGMFYVQNSPYPSIKDRPGFIAWLDERNMGSLAPRSVNFQTLRSWTKERLTNGSELPDPAILDYFIKRDIRVRKG